MKGHLRHRGEDRWSLVVDFPRKPDGRRNQKWFSFRASNREAAEKKQVEILHGLNTGIIGEPSDLILADYLEHWLAQYGESNLQPSTLSQYGTLIEKHINPVLGGYRLADLTAYHIQQFLREKGRSGRLDGTGGLSASTCKTMYAILHRSLKHAVQWQLLDRNPAEPVTPPSVKRSTSIQYLEPNDVPRYLYHAREYRHYPILFLAVHTGMRQGEILCLQWADIEENTVRVRRSLSRTMDGEIYFGNTKTRGSRRAISISDKAVRVLGHWRTQQARERLETGELYQRSDLVFTTNTGGILNPRNVLRTHYLVLEAAGLPKTGFHALRHTHATLLLRAGVHPKVVQERLGHSSITMTLDTYSHVIPSLQDELAEHLDAFIEGTTRSEERL